MFSSAQREGFIETLDAYSFDVVVIGGGITGAGIALDAVSRGLSVALIDMQDFASGTSSRSTKLVHGGLRYLKQLQIGVVAEVGKERAIVYENGVHITTPQWMLLPFYKGGTFGPYSTSLGLKVYDNLARVNKSERRKMLSAKETLQKEPLLKKDGLLGGGYYVEYRTDDARLTIEVIKKAVELGAVCLNYVKAEEFKYDKEKITGVVVRDQITSRTWTIQSNTVVNATGPWVDEVRKKDQISNNKQLRLTKGVHIVIDQSRFPLQQSVYFDTPDGRMVFAIPRDGKTYVGTTDTFYVDNPVNPVATDEDVAYLMDTIHYIFPDVQVTQKDVESSWAGVRPLIFKEGKDPSEISRKDEIWESPSGLLTIAGGKLTGYRKMAENILDKIVEKKPFRKSGPCVTEHMSLSGAKGINSINFGPYVKNKTYEGTKLGLTKEEAHMLVSKYGTNIQEIFNIIHTLKVNNSVVDLPIAIHAQLLYAIQNEMAQTPADFFVRRSSRLLFDIDSVYEHKEAVIKLMKKYLSYSAAQEEQYRIELDQLLFEASHFAKEDIYE
ncbi:glycerol-3-phosphate dehydrogenase/oxidase [Viridibacillus sp. NPDC096237]|uniref:glycerol-3-phosphate dehydrogenase/oxidase n=1 Tax=Viridibacillus sp. NPDC096237 TaxID=3390721 RepID=UPI003D039017